MNFDCVLMLNFKGFENNFLQKHVSIYFIFMFYEQCYIKIINFKLVIIYFRQYFFQFFGTYNIREN